jgi:hypothetical protein
MTMTAAGHRGSLKTLIFWAERRKLKVLMSDDQFTRLEKYLDERFDLLEKRIDFNEQLMRSEFATVRSEVAGVRSEVDHVRNAVDGIAGRLDTIETEMAARNHQVDRRLDRHEGWIKKLADHSSVRLDPQAG